MRFQTMICTSVFAIAAVVGSSSAAEQMVGVRPSDGVTMLAKRFSVPAGTTIIGAEFRNNDSRTVFPEVLLVQGVTSAIGEGTVVGRVTNANEVSGGSVRVTWSSPLVAQAGEYFVAIRVPAGAGKLGAGSGPAIGAVDATTPLSSFLTAGASGILCPISVDLTVNLITVGPGKAVPAELPTEMGGAYETFLKHGGQNPAGAIAYIRFGIERRARVELSIHNVAGQRVRTLVQEVKAAGAYSEEWNGRDEQGRGVADGVYIATLRAGRRIVTQKIVLAR